MLNYCFRFIATTRIYSYLDGIHKFKKASVMTRVCAIAYISAGTLFLFNGATSMHRVSQPTCSD